MQLAQQRTLDDFYARSLAMVRNHAIVMGDGYSHEAYPSGDRFILKFRCKDTIFSIGWCIMFIAHVEPNDTDQMTLSDVPFDAWRLFEVECANHIGKRTTDSKPCCAIESYKQHVSPWTIAGRLAPAIGSWSRPGPLVIPGRLDSSRCFLCNNITTNLERLLPDGTYCCDRMQCINTIGTFVQGAHLCWCIRQSELCADVVYLIASSIAQLITKER